MKKQQKVLGSQSGYHSSYAFTDIKIYASGYSHYFFSLALFLLIFGYNLSLFAAASHYPAILGNSYNSLTLQHLHNSCVVGELQITPAVEVIGEFNKIENWSRFIAQLNFSVPGAIYINKNSGLSKFAFRARDTLLSSTYIMKQHVGVKIHILKNVKYVDEIKSYSNFFEQCGNKYTSVVEKGGTLYVGIKFSFFTIKHRRQFEIGGAIKTIAGLGMHVKSLSGQVSQNSSVEIFFHQTGGDLKDLSSMFDSKDIVACSLKNFSRCENLIKDLWSYSTDQFTKSIFDGKLQTIGFKTSDYSGHKKIYPDPQVIKERRKLLTLLDQAQLQRDHLALITTQTDEFSSCDDNCLFNLTSEINFNVRILKEAIELSFLDDNHFKKTGVVEKLELYDITLPTPKKRRWSLIQHFNKINFLGLSLSLIPTLYFFYKKSVKYNLKS